MQRKFPSWLRATIPYGDNYIDVRDRLKESQLHTVCQEARCPNIGDCWDRRTATFMILGDICTRACRYCAVTTGRPIGLDIDEPRRLAETVQYLQLKYVVITSVNRDDLPDGGAYIFSQCISQIRKRLPGCKIEVLIPDFQGNDDALRLIVDSNPDVLNHNIETVERIFHSVRPKGSYQKSLELISNAKYIAARCVTKSGMMIGLGETRKEISQTMKDLRSVNCDLLTVGQYLRPSEKHIKISKFYTPQEFLDIQEEGISLGFRHVASGPLVRSSYHADEQYTAVHVTT